MKYIYSSLKTNNKETKLYFIKRQPTSTSTHENYKYSNDSFINSDSLSRIG